MSRSPTADEAAAIAAAVERFRVDLAPAAEARPEDVGPWQRAALIEGVGAKETVLDSEGGARWLS
jgi:hypothetical protein